MDKLKSYTLNAAILAAGGVTAGLAVSALWQLPAAAERSLGGILALGVIALVAKIPKLKESENNA